jgi:Cft2 family RNA processing exonuclease
MRVTFLGGADEVGASGILIEIAGLRLLVDAGLRPSPKARSGLSGDQLPDLSAVDRAGGVDAIFLTHAHMDHSGALELVVGRYPRCPVYATPATVILTRVLHRDGRRIMQSRLEEEGDLPLYDDVAADRLIDSFIPVPPGAPVHLGGGLAVTLYPAGHIPGAAMVAIESDAGSVLVSGDVAVSPQRTVDGLRPPPLHPDVLILESTYGGRLHANRAAEERRLVDTIAAVTAAGGKVLIPAFALGRAQEVLLTLAEFRRQGELPNVTVWADGLVRAICAAFGQFPEALSKALQEGGVRFFDEQTRPVQSEAQRNGIAWEETPAVIVSSSGMLSGGPAVEYAKALAGHPQHAILLTGYQDEEAPGRRLQELAERGKGTLKLGPDKVDVQCHIAAYALSAHADEGQLVSLVEVLDPRQVLLVHGGDAARASLAAALRQRGRPVLLPHGGQSLDLAVAPSPLPRLLARGLGQGQPLEVRALWLAVGDPGGGTFSAADLARVWWGEEDRVDEISAALSEDELYFLSPPNWPGLYQARTRAQVEQALARRERLAALPDLDGQLVVLRDAQGAVRLASVTGVGSDSIQIAGEDTRHAPEEVLEVVGPAVGVDVEQVELAAATVAARDLFPDERSRSPDEIVARLGLPAGAGAARAAVALALWRAGAERTPEGYVLPLAARTAGLLEPNQALAVAREQFPPEACLRKCGYQRATGVITLTFDFPDWAVGRYGAAIAQAERLTGWRVQVNPEANQQALNELVHRLIPAGWTLSKPPAIHRERKEVELTLYGGREMVGPAAETFFQATGYALLVTLVEAPAAAGRPEQPADRWEINAAYAEVRRALAGSTLYKTSLKGGRIVLSFISPQVGERCRAVLAGLEERLGWPLEVNPNPNQGAILAEARALVGAVGGQIVRGPSIFVDRGDVVAVLAGALEEETRAGLQAAFLERTGYRLVLSWEDAE